ncbi:substrate-binding domain-containing protein [Salicibibacter cibi]|uniref:Substrate-binding domain-containing protein n=1 Tax=Salicibibacter cibi TaxID=2743001 RepID=A0A7T6ZEI7_9BACI|nr:substrate-binding domain-containing protein [Salicibibacter cibi]QQK81951.1 substrate-binding domain-containing protein [Salicibibacter cibi]
METGEGANLSVYEEVLKQQVDGIVLSSIFIDDPIYQELVASGIPFVMFNRRYSSGGNYIEINDEKAGQLATNHLLKLGYVKIAWIGGPTHASTFQGRLSGYQKAMTSANHPVGYEWIKETDTTELSVVKAVDALLLLDTNRHFRGDRLDCIILPKLLTANGVPNPQTL